MHTKLKQEYAAALAWLWRLVKDPEGKRFMVDKTAETRRQEMQEAMVRMRRFMAFAGNPESQLRAFHIAGTSGKGSVTTMLDKALRDLGYSTTSHTSPYLQLPLEKLIINGRWTKPSEFVTLMDAFRSLYERYQAENPADHWLKYGEAWVALTLFWMAQSKTDWAVMETGLGGRFDPTNVMPAEVAIVTNIGWDHVKSLGPTLKEIAWHKAGIIKPNKPAVTGVTDPELLPVIEAEAAEKAAPLYVLGRDFDFSVDQGMLTLNGPSGRTHTIAIGGQKGYQRLNAAVALAALDLALDGRSLDPISFADLAHPGRMEIMQSEPLVMLDGAHNPHKMTALVQSVIERYPNKRIVGLVGSIRSKNAGDTLRPLLEIVDELIVTKPQVPGKPAIDPAEIIDVLPATKPMRPIEDDREALNVGLQSTGHDDLLLITGSLYLVGGLRDHWHPTEQLFEAAEMAAD